MCRWENGGMRLGLRFVKGLRERSAKKIEEQQQRVIPSVSEGPCATHPPRSLATLGMTRVFDENLS
jgi:hypothetical protein